MRESSPRLILREKAAAEMQRPFFAWKRSGSPSYNLSVSLRSTAPLVEEPLAERKTLNWEGKLCGMPKPPLGRGGGTASAVTERLSPAAAHGQACKLSVQCLTFAGNGIYYR